MDSIIAGNLNRTVCPTTPTNTLVVEGLEFISVVWGIGTFCIFCWELIVCAPNEYRLVWSKSSMNTSNLLYLANRYWLLFVSCFNLGISTTAQTPSACKRLFPLLTIGSLISTILSQAVLGSRVFAIYERNKALGYLLGGTLLGEAIVGGIAISTSSSALIQNPRDFANPSCGMVSAPFRWLVVYWMTPLFYDSLTFLLTAWKAYSIWKRETNVPIFNIIWYDGLLYFFAISAMNIINVMILFLAPAGLQDFNMMPTLTFQVILSSRMFLHLKGSGPSTDSIRNAPNSLSTLRFCSCRSNGIGSRDHSTSAPTSGIGTNVHEGKLPDKER